MYADSKVAPLYNYGPYEMERMDPLSSSVST
jgi:hypothetical protein